MESPTSGPDAASVMLDPRRLLIFREIARRGSLSAAATALGWTQPAVGQHLQRLEREVGLPLALRSTRGVTLTDAGAALLAHADAVAARLGAAREEMRTLTTLRGGRLRLAAFPSACAVLVPAALVDLARLAPELDVRLAELEPPEARALVLAGDADVALTFHHDTAEDADRQRDLRVIALLDDPVLAVLPSGHELAGRGPVALAELAAQRWIAGCPRCRDHLLATARAAAFVPDVRHSTDDYVVAQTLVAAGLGVTLLPELALEAAPNPEVASVVLQPPAMRHIRLVVRASWPTRPRSPRPAERCGRSRRGSALGVVGDRGPDR